MRRPRGIAIIIVLQVLAVVLVTALALLMTTDANSNFVRVDRRSSQSLYDAEGGVRVVIKELYDKLNGAYVSSGATPFAVVDAYHNRTITGTMFAPDGTSVGQYTVKCTVEPPTGAPKTDDPAFQQYKTVTLNAVGTVDGMRRSLVATLKAGFKPPPAFQYAAYINNYSYLNNLYCPLIYNGNVAANGDMDNFNSTAQVNGNPVYDQNGNVVSMGGRSAAGGFGGNGTWQNYGATTAEQKVPFISMPSLARMDYFASVATGTVTQVGHGTLITGVFGQTGTKNIVLDGLAGAISINGTVVIKGDCIIRGTLNGQGTLYVGGNLYIGGNVNYGTPYYTTNPRPIYDPAHGDTPESYYGKLISNTTSWYNATKTKPAVSFCVANNIVIGDVSSSYWWYGCASSNKTSYTNQTNYDSRPGVSGLITATDPNTHTKQFVDMHEDAGFDKIWGSGDSTEDDRPDHKWTVQVDNGTTVKTMDLTVSGGVAQVPGGWSVIPGTGEDVDGNGKYTPAYTYNDFLFRDASGNPTTTLSSTTYSGWVGTTTYTAFAGDFANMNFPTNLDGFYFCNHLIIGYIGNLNSNITMHGGYAARQLLCLIWCAANRSMTIEHDDRITQQFGNAMPGVAAVSAVQWQDGP